MRHRISIRVCVRPSIYPSVENAFIKNARKSFISPILSLPFNALGHLALVIYIPASLLETYTPLIKEDSIRPIMIVVLSISLSICWSRIISTRSEVYDMHGRSRIKGKDI